MNDKAICLSTELAFSNRYGSRNLSSERLAILSGFRIEITTKTLHSFHFYEFYGDGGYLAMITEVHLSSKYRA